MNVLFFYCLFHLVLIYLLKTVAMICDSRLGSIWPYDRFETLSFRITRPLVGTLGDIVNKIICDSRFTIVLKWSFYQIHFLFTRPVAKSLGVIVKNFSPNGPWSVLLEWKGTYNFVPIQFACIYLDHWQTYSNDCCLIFGMRLGSSQNAILRFYSSRFIRFYKIL